MSIDGRIVTFVIPAATNIHLQRKLPTLLIGKICPHFLYDAACRVDRPTFTVTRTISVVAGNLIYLTSLPNADPLWAKFGIFLHTATGQSMTILNQNNAFSYITLEAPIYELQSGDSVEISAGCDHTIGNCSLKFSNKVNFGGFPQLPTKNIFLPDGLGVLEQE
jgi:uncharacterized phage protein (TIGR02218 family)